MKMRYIFHGGAREITANNIKRPLGIAHNSAFYHAAQNVGKDYKSGNVRLIKISTAADMVRELNSNSLSAIASLDIVCHGTPYSLNFSVKENKNCGLVTGWMAKQMIALYYSATDDGIYSFSDDNRYVSDINFKVFVNDARIQIHGCNTARGSMPGNTLVETLSEELYKAGKNNSYVIGHTDKSNPNINGSNTTIRQQDYRHGERSIYHNGKPLYKTTKKGVIRHSEIQSLIDRNK